MNNTENFVIFGPKANCTLEVSLVLDRDWGQRAIGSTFSLAAFLVPIAN